MRNLIAGHGRSGRTSTFLVVFLAIFFVVGAGIEMVGVYFLIKSSKSSSWPSTDGVVKSAELKTNSGEDGNTYGVDISYNYAVNEKPFTGYKIRMVKVESSKKADAQQDLARYPVEGKVKVYYSPSDPADCVLEPGVHPSSWFLPGIGVGFLLFALIGAAAMRLKK